MDGLPTPESTGLDPETAYEHRCPSCHVDEYLCYPGLDTNGAVVFDCECLACGWTAESVAPADLTPIGEV